jgi:hypothetical protein
MNASRVIVLITGILVAGLALNTALAQTPDQPSKDAGLSILDDHARPARHHAKNKDHQVVNKMHHHALKAEAKENKIRIKHDHKFEAKHELKDHKHVMKHYHKHELKAELKNENQYMKRTDKREVKTFRKQFE